MDRLDVFLCTDMQKNEFMNTVIEGGSCTISSWIAPEDLSKDEPGYIR